MYKYIGEFEELEKLGFVTDYCKRYYFLPTHKISNKYLSPLTINIDTRMVEYTYDYQLKIIKDKIEKLYNNVQEQSML